MQRPPLNAVSSGRHVVRQTGATIALLSFPAVAQTTASAEQPPVGLEEMIGTAQKRSERLQDVPLSVAVLGESSIEQQGLSSLDDISKRVAGMAMLPGTARGQFTSRGITTAVNGVTTSPAAGLFVDEYPLYDTWFPLASPDPRIVHVERSVTAMIGIDAMGRRGPCQAAQLFRQSRHHDAVP